MQFPAYQSSDDQVRRIVKKVAKELGGFSAQAIGKIEYEELLNDGPPPKDRRGWFRRFVESTQLVTAKRALVIDVPVGERVLQLGMHIGGERPMFHHPVCLELTLATISKAVVPAPAVYRKSTGRWEGADALNGVPELKKACRSLLQTRYMIGASVFIPDATLSIEPHGKGSVIVARTLPQEKWGGFVHQLGVRDFLQAATLIDAMLLTTAAIAT